MRHVLAVAALLGLLGSPLRAVGGTITNGAVTFKRTAYGSGPAADLTGVATNALQDTLTEAGWWFRVGGDTQETPFPNPDVEMWSGNQGELQWNDVGGRGLFWALELDQVNDLSGDVGHPAGQVLSRLGVTNLTNAPLHIELFYYADLDIDGFTSDSAVRVEKTPQEVLNLSDPGGDFGQFLANYAGVSYHTDPSKIHFGVGAWNTLLVALNDTGITNYANSPTTFGPADFTGVYQFSLDLPAMGGAPAFVVLVVNAHYRCGELNGIFCDGFETGDRSLWGP